MGGWIRLLSVACATAACGGGGGGDVSASGSTPDSPASRPAVNTSPFTDATPASNIAYVVDITPPYLLQTELDQITFGGAAAGDCDLDGDEDLFITYGDGGPNRLYLNQLDAGNPLQFSDSAAAAGVAFTREAAAAQNHRHSGPAFADMDGDGDLDLFLGGMFGDPNRVYANDGNCRFTDVSAASGIENLLTDQTISAAFGDYDLDGDLDLFLTHWGSADPAGDPEYLFRNVSTNGAIRFENVSVETGVAALVLENRIAYNTRDPITDYTYTPTFARIDEDAWPDIALAADFSTAQLLLNNAAAPGTFVDGNNADVRSVQYAMGSALGDIDFDGDLDWFVTSIFSTLTPSGTGFERPIGNHLYLNSGADFSSTGYVNISESARVQDGGWGWGACFLDIDNDTDLDIYHTNGWYTEYLDDNRYVADMSRVFVSDFANGGHGFDERARDMGLADADSGRGVVCADFDNDGDIDILQLTNDETNSASLWENDSAAAGNNFLRVRLIGLAPNSEAAGARIFLRIRGRTQMREIMIGSNYTSQNPAVQVFGLGADSSADELRVEWPARVPAPGTDPVAPAPTIVPLAEVNSRVGVARATLVVCHPSLPSPPSACSNF